MVINLSEKHLQLLLTILNRYDYSFFLFGSRITQNIKQFSDIDLVHFEKIPNEIILRLEEAFEESDLPYTVDLVNYNTCDEDFQKVIENGYVCLKRSSKLQIIENNHLKHFEFLPKKLGFEIREENGLYIINCGLGSSMFNIAYGAPFTLEDIKLIIEQVKAEFKNQAFAWWVPPSLRSPELTQALLQANLTVETTEHAMICDLTAVPATEYKTNLIINPVLEKSQLEDFVNLLEPYDSSARSFYAKLQNEHLHGSERLFVGYAQDQPVTIAILFHGMQSASGIFSLLTHEDGQGRGYGTDMMQYLLHAAKEHGSEYVTLSASSDSGYRIYERLGFQKIGAFECFEYKI